MTPLESDSGAEWLKGEGAASDVVMSSRVRLARNFAGFPFLSKASHTERRQILDLVQQHVLSGDLRPGMIWVDLTELPVLERRVLVERHLISKQHAKGNVPRGVAISTPDERLAIMVNEEDHLRIQMLRSGFALSSIFNDIDKVDDDIETRIDYAFSPRFGYLTACPTNVGTGIRVSVMLHLPALKVTGDIEKVRRAAKGMSLAVRGFYGEGSEAAGDFYQISNQTTLGKSERDLLVEFEHNIIPKVIEYERVARRLLLQRRRPFFEDKVFRALGLLQNARLLKVDEAMFNLSLVKLGISAEIIPDIDIRTVNHLFLLVQPAHLQKVLKRDLDQAERRIERATIIRRQLRA